MYVIEVHSVPRIKVNATERIFLFVTRTFQSLKKRKKNDYWLNRKQRDCSHKNMIVFGKPVHATKYFPAVFQLPMTFGSRHRAKFVSELRTLAPQQRFVGTFPIGTLANKLLRKFHWMFCYKDPGIGKKKYKSARNNSLEKKFRHRDVASAFAKRINLRLSRGLKRKSSSLGVGNAALLKKCVLLLFHRD